MSFKTIVLAFFLLSSTCLMAQVGVGTTTPDASAQMDITSTNKGFLIPRMTLAQRNDISSPASGLLVYQTDDAVGFYYNQGSPNSPNWIQLGARSNLSFGYVYSLPTLIDATVVGGADLPFSNNGPLSDITHIAGTTTITVPNTGCYAIAYNVTTTAGIGASIAIAVNGTVDPSTNISSVVAVGQYGGVAILTLAAGDVITLRNNSLIPFVMNLAPGVGAQLKIIQLN